MKNCNSFGNLSPSAEYGTLILAVPFVYDFNNKVDEILSTSGNVQPQVWEQNIPPAKISFSVRSQRLLSFLY
jgi:hypothetical protein